jgi:murein DD-endopeptidase MepM/ murein hydrolase activator NlpD
MRRGIIIGVIAMSLVLVAKESSSSPEIITAATTGTSQTYLPVALKAGLSPQLIWPIGCIPGETCSGSIGYPDIDNDGAAFNCGLPGYRGHQGTDIGITWQQMDQGIPVFAAAAGQVLWVFDGKYDRCPSSHPDCQGSGTTVCTQSGPYCGTGTCCCTWCFAGGNVVVIRHTDLAGVFATRYDHLRTNSILVTPGQLVSKGQKIAEVGSAGNSSGPHLHFEVWGSGFYQLADPWAGPCGPNFNNPLWAYDPPWRVGRTPLYGQNDMVQRYEAPLTSPEQLLCPPTSVESEK